MGTLVQTRAYMNTLMPGETWTLWNLISFSALADIIQYVHQRNAIRSRDVGIGAASLQCVFEHERSRRFFGWRFFRIPRSSKHEAAHSCGFDNVFADQSYCWSPMQTISSWLELLRWRWRTFVHDLQSHWNGRTTCCCSTNSMTSTMTFEKLRLGLERQYTDGVGCGLIK